MLGQTRLVQAIAPWHILKYANSAKLPHERIFDNKASGCFRTFRVMQITWQSSRDQCVKINDREFNASQIMKQLKSHNGCLIKTFKIMNA
jgi:hypothetical protein